MIHIRKGPVESWRICTYEAIKSLRTVRSARLGYCFMVSARLGYCFMVYYSQVIPICDPMVVYYAVAPTSITKLATGKFTDLYFIWFSSKFVWLIKLMYCLLFWVGPIFTTASTIMLELRRKVTILG
jgi:hypothetical protein